MSLRTLVALSLLYVLPASGQARLLASATLLATPTAHRAASHSPTHCDYCSPSLPLPHQGLSRSVCLLRLGSNIL